MCLDSFDLKYKVHGREQVHVGKGPQPGAGSQLPRADAVSHGLLTQL